MKPWQIAHGYLGTPFVHQGRSDKGLDCCGLIAVTLKDCGLSVHDRQVYGTEPTKENDAYGLLDYLRRNFGPPVKRRPRVNDVVAMQLAPGLVVGHVGIIAPHPHGLGIIHTRRRVGKVVYHRLEPRRQRLIREVYAWPKQPV